MMPYPTTDGPPVMACAHCGHEAEMEEVEEVTEDLLDEVATWLRPAMEWAALRHREAGWSVPKGRR